MPGVVPSRPILAKVKKMIRYKPLIGVVNLLLVWLAVGCNTSYQGTTPVTTLQAQDPPMSGTPVTSSASEIQYRCLEIQGDNPQTTDISGTLVFRSEVDILDDDLLLLNLASREQKGIPTRGATNYAISPGGTLLAFDSLVQHEAQADSQSNIIDSNGQLVIAINKETGWTDFEWLNEEILLINFPGRGNPLVSFALVEREQRIIEPFITETGFFEAELIDKWGFYANHRIVYDSRLTRALYALLNEKGPQIVLHDIEINEDLMFLPTYEGWGTSPKWSPNGEHIAIALNTNSSFQVDGMRKYELFIIDRDGDKFYATNLAEISESIYISSLSWSPDSSHIAFWYTASNNSLHENLELAMLNVDTKKITNYCMSKNEETHSWKRNDISPIWSPDSAALLIEIPDTGNVTPSTLIVDILQEKAILIKSGMIPVGWMK